MKVLEKMKDGGPESSVTGYWLIESKRFFSITLLKFQGKSREAFHSHAFNSIAWVLKGKLKETRMWHHTVNGINYDYREHKPSLIPIIIGRNDFHKVDSDGTSWVLNIRGPWADKWFEWRPKENRYVTLTEGRVES